MAAVEARWRGGREDVPVVSTPPAPVNTPPPSCLYVPIQTLPQGPAHPDTLHTAPYTQESPAT